MNDKAQNTEPLDLETLGAMPMNQALPIIMEQYHVDKDDALELWINNGPPTGFEDVIRLSPEEFDKYREESKKTSTYLFSFGGKKNTDQSE